MEKARDNCEAPKAEIVDHDSHVCRGNTSWEPRRADLLIATTHMSEKTSEGAIFRFEEPQLDQTASRPAVPRPSYVGR